jgi:hypothetical protein
LVLKKTFIITCVSLSFEHVQNRESQSMQDAGSSPPKAHQDCNDMDFHTNKENCAMHQKQTSVYTHV